jgi:TRAP-type mannitol/chloroaromatic compound transport system permease small subunit
LRLVILGGAAVFIPVLIKASYDLFSWSIDFGMRSGTWLRVPLGPIQIFIFIGLILLFIQVVIELVKVIRNLKSGQGDTS